MSSRTYWPRHRIYRVGEHQAVVVFELEAWPEPKALGREELRVLMKRFSSTVKVAKHIGTSQVFVWDKLSGRKWDAKKRSFTK